MKLINVWIKWINIKRRIEWRRIIWLIIGIIIIWLIIMKNRRLNKKIKEEWNKNEINKLMMIT